MGITDKIGKIKKKNLVNDFDDDELDDSNEAFHDMEEIEGDIYVGTGLKRMKGYKCDLAIDILNQMREEFWNKKTDSKNHI